MATFAGSKTMGGSYVSFNGYRKISDADDRSVWQPQIGLAREAPAGSDTAAYFEGRITVTPLRFDWTDRTILKELGAWLPSSESQ